MNRRGFLNGLTGTAAALVATPVSAAQLILPESMTKDIITDLPEEAIVNIVDKQYLDLTGRITSFQFTETRDMMYHHTIPTPGLTPGRVLKQVEIYAYFDSPIPIDFAETVTINMGEKFGGIIRVVLKEIEVSAAIMEERIIKLEGYVVA